MNGSLVGSTALEGHDQGVDDQVGVGRVGHGPADHSAAVEVDDAGEVEPALLGAELGHVGRPELIGSSCSEVPLDQVGCRGHVGTTGAPTPPGMGANQARFGHQPGDALSVQRWSSRRSSAWSRGAPWSSGSVDGSRRSRRRARHLGYWGRGWAPDPGVVAERETRRPGTTA